MSSPNSDPLIRVNELPQLPARPDEAHKGTFGRVLVVGGSRGMSGAACLAGQAALRGGAGLVFLAVPLEILPVVAANEPSYLTIPLPADAEGCIRETALATLEPPLENASAVALGPGCGQSGGLTRLVERLYADVRLPMVVDADALNALSEQPDLVQRAPGAAPRILTPHPGEFARLTGQTIAALAEDREGLAVAFARQNNVVLVLKGHRSLITDGRRLALNQTGNPGMATGGTGDVLTGLIAALAAQGLPAFEAAQLGVHLHGLAGDLAAEALSQPGLIASDLPHYLTQAWLQHGATTSNC